MVRLEGATIRREINRGEIRPDVALDDLRAQALRVGEFLAAPRRKGAHWARWLCGVVRVNPEWRLREMTVRQRNALRDALRAVEERRPGLSPREAVRRELGAW